MVPVFLVSRGENFNSGSKMTTFDHSELLCSKVFFNITGIEKASSKRGWKGGPRRVSTPLARVFSKALHIVSEMLIIDKRNTRLADRTAPGSSPITYILR